MKYDIIHLNGFMYAVEKFKKRADFPYICLEKLLTEEWMLWQVDNENDWDEKNQVNIVATNNPELNLPLLPGVEEDIEQLAIKNWHILIPLSWKTPDYYISGFKQGYKAASAKQFTEDDMLRLATHCWNIASNPVPGKTYDINSIVQNYIQSLRPKPVAVKLETKDITPVNEVGNDGFEFDSSSTIPPKQYQLVVDQNNYVTVKQWYFS